MAPYLFIIAMDPLARWLNNHMLARTIRWHARMVCSMFANDLILMGTLTQEEVDVFHDTLTSFSLLIGLTQMN